MERERERAILIGRPACDQKTKSKELCSSGKKEGGPELQHKPRVLASPNVKNISENVKKDEKENT